MSVIPSEQSEPRDLHAGTAAALVERALRCAQNVIRCQKSLNTEQLAVGASRPVDGMRRNQRRPAAPHGVQGPRPLVGKGFSKGETTIGFAL